MDQLRAMRIFAAVAEQGGFAAAARRLGISPPTATRAVEALETHLGVALLRRTTRAVGLTPEGAAYLAHCRRVLAEIDEADRVASGAAVEPRGPIAVTAPVQFGKLHVAPLVFDFIARHPSVPATLTLLDRRVSLVEEGFDLAFRIGRPGDRALVAARLGRMRSVVCASPDYLARRGVPAHPRELAGHDLVELSAMGAFGAVWRFRDGERDRELRLAPRLVANTTDVAVAAACAGVGITRVLHYQVAEPLAAGRLVPLLEGFERPPVPVTLVLGAGRPGSATVRRFVELARERFRGGGLGA